MTMVESEHLLMDAPLGLELIPDQYVIDLTEEARRAELQQIAEYKAQWDDYLIHEATNMGWIGLGGLACRAKTLDMAHQATRQVVAERQADLAGLRTSSDIMAGRDAVYGAMEEVREVRGLSLEGFRATNIAIAQQVVAAATGNQGYRGWSMQQQLEGTAEVFARALAAKHDTPQHILSAYRVEQRVRAY